MFFWFQEAEVGSKNRSKIDQKMVAKKEGVLASIFNGFWWFLGAKMAPKSIKNRYQDAFQFELHFFIDFWWIFDGFWLPSWVLGTQFGPSGLDFSWFLWFFARIDFWFDFGANLAPFWLPKSTKIDQKSDLERHQKIDPFLHRFLNDFGSILGSAWAPGRRQNRTKTRPGRARRAPKTAPELLWPPKMNFWSTFDHFWSILARIWGRFGLDLGWFFGQSTEQIRRENAA